MAVASSENQAALGVEICFDVAAHKLIFSMHQLKVARPPIKLSVKQNTA